MASGSKRARRPSEKGAALLEEKNHKGQQKKSKSKRKRTRKKTGSDSENGDSSGSVSSEEEPRFQKRRRQPDPEEIELSNHPSDGEPEEVDEGSSAEEIGVDVDDGDRPDAVKEGEEDDIQLIDEVSVAGLNRRLGYHQFADGRGSNSS
jgi:hypothetical protein